MDLDIFYKIIASPCKFSSWTYFPLQRKLSKYEVFSGPYFLVFGLNTEIYGVNLCTQSEYRKIWTRENSGHFWTLFGHFSRSVLFWFSQNKMINGRGHMLKEHLVILYEIWRILPISTFSHPLFLTKDYTEITLIFFLNFNSKCFISQTVQKLLRLSFSMKAG